MTYAAVVAGGAPFVHLGEHGRSADRQDSIVEIFRQAVAKSEFRAVHFHRREKFSVGQLRQAFRLPADAGEFFNIVVPGRDVRIANRPVDGNAVFQIRLKIEIAPTIALAPPSDRLSADLATANPGKF
jgi:hypothetical protein